jgi:hypothetical protein
MASITFFINILMTNLIACRYTTVVGLNYEDKQPEIQTSVVNYAVACLV